MRRRDDVARAAHVDLPRPVGAVLRLDAGSRELGDDERQVHHHVLAAHRCGDVIGIAQVAPHHLYAISVLAGFSRVGLCLQVEAAHVMALLEQFLYGARSDVSERAG